MSKSKKTGRRLLVLAICTVILAVFGTRIGFAQAETVAAPTMEDVTNLTVSIDTAWVIITSFLVFFMQAGFAFLETGLIRQTSAVNSLVENFIDACVTGIVWWLVGFGIAFGASSNGLFGTSLFAPGLEYMGETFGSLNIGVLTMFFFQFAFAATATTIMTGAMAERTDFIGHLILSALIAIFIYPPVVHWVWGGGWLSGLGFHDFAGSTVVHTVGAVIALIGAAMLGPRPGRVFGKPPRPHNLGYAALGTLILWFGWYGFNPGSTLGAVGYGSLIGLVTLNTTLAAVTAALSAMFVMYARSGKWDLPAMLNGSLAGLVGITAGCAFVSPVAAVAIGITAGVVVIFATEIVERAKIDDAVGAFAVHGACGIMGTLAIGLWGDASLTLTGQAGLFLGGGLELLGVQALGSAATILYVTTTSIVMFGVLKAVNRLRVSSKADAIGIDVYEHGASVWPDILPYPDELPVEGAARKAPAVGD